MSDALATAARLNLPLLPAVAGSEDAPSWRGWSPTHPLPAAPEPLQPQGAYAEVTQPRSMPSAPAEAPTRPVELLAPAGGLDAAFAAFHFGADAVYLGLKKFSARAEAENFTLDEVDEIVANAHNLNPHRRVFVT